jgi:peptide/nickel transport system substrate-binding protein
VNRTLRPTRLLAVLLAIGLVAAACSSSKSDTATTATTQVVVPQGGNLVIGAEQEPDCVDWIASCAQSSWGYWMLDVNTMPRAYDAVNNSGSYSYAPSVLLQGEATLETKPQQKVTYKLNPNAVWSDGVAITSADFKYTWNQIVTGSDILDATGYKNIESVATPDPQTAVVTFATGKNYTAWKGLFGGGYGLYPSHLLEGKDRDALTKDGYTWSGGPFMLKEWAKGESMTLVPNPKWYGANKAHVDSAIFKFTADTAAEFKAFSAGEVKLIAPQPQLDAVDQIAAGLPDANSTYTAQTGSFEALWMNMAAAPLDDLKVRQAVAYAIDRDAIVNQLFGKLGVTSALQVMNAPIVDQYSDTQSFAGYAKDLSKVDALLTGDGYAKGSDGIYAKDGKKLEITIKSTAGNKRRELTEQVIQKQLADAGITLTIANTKAGDLFGTVLPAGDFQAALYAQQLTSIDPGRCNIFCSQNIPTDANGQSGQNSTRTNVPTLDPLLQTVDSNLDESARIEANRQADPITAEQMISLPIDPLPSILLWSKSVVGPVQDNQILGPFWNLADLGVTS